MLRQAAGAAASRAMIRCAATSHYERSFASAKMTRMRSARESDLMPDKLQALAPPPPRDAPAAQCAGSGSDTRRREMRIGMQARRAADGRVISRYFCRDELPCADFIIYYCHAGATPPSRKMMTLQYATIRWALDDISCQGLEAGGRRRWARRRHFKYRAALAEVRSITASPLSASLPEIRSSIRFRNAWSLPASAIFEPRMTSANFAITGAASGRRRLLAKKGHTSAKASRVPRCAFLEGRFIAISTSRFLSSASSRALSPAAPFHGIIDTRFTRTSRAHIRVSQCRRRAEDGSLFSTIRPRWRRRFSIGKMRGRRRYDADATITAGTAFRRRHRHYGKFLFAMPIGLEVSRASPAAAAARPRRCWPMTTRRVAASRAITRILVRRHYRPIIFH